MTQIAFISINGEPRPIAAPSTLFELLKELAPRKPFAVAHNEVFIPRELYSDITINPGDRVEVLHAAAGG